MKFLLFCLLAFAQVTYGTTPAEPCRDGLANHGRRNLLLGSGATLLAAYLGWRFLFSGNTPRLFLVQENHDSAEARATMRTLGGRGLRGEVLVGYENLLTDGNRAVQQRSFRKLSGARAEDDATIYGLELPEVHAGVELFLLRESFSGVAQAPSIETWTATMTAWSVLLRDNPYQTKLWTDFAKDKPLMKDALTLVTSADWVKELESASPEEEVQAFRRRAALLGRAPFLRDRAFGETFAVSLIDVMKKYVDFMNEAESKRRFNTPASLSRLLLSRVPRQEDFTDTAIRWRNEQMYAAITRLWVLAVQEGKDLYLVVGAQHRPMLERYILENLKPSRFQVVERVE